MRLSTDLEYCRLYKESHQIYMPVEISLQALFYMGEWCSGSTGSSKLLSLRSIRSSFANCGLVIEPGVQLVKKLFQDREGKNRLQSQVAVVGSYGSAMTKNQIHDPTALWGIDQRQSAQRNGCSRIVSLLVSPKPNLKSHEVVVGDDLRGRKVESDICLDGGIGRHA